jgi:hypothetical protein
LYHSRSNVYFAALNQEDADAVQRGGGLLAGVAMVALQCLVVLGVWLGSAIPVCSTSDQCPQAGTFCSVGVRDRCNACGTSQPLPPQTDPASGGTLNAASAPGFAGFNLTAVAELCAGPSLYAAGPMPDDWKWDYATASSVVSWCKSGNAALGLFILGALLAHDKCGPQARPASTRSTARWTR